MNKPEFRILETLAKDLDANRTIRGLNQAMATPKKPVHYPQTYNQVKEMEKKGILRLKQSGASKLVSINFQTQQALTGLTEMEVVRTGKIYRQHLEFDRTHEKLEKFFIEQPCLVAAAATADSRLSALNKMELSLLVRALESETGRNSEEMAEYGRNAVAAGIRKLESDTQIRISPLILTESEFIDALFATPYNPVKALFRKQVKMFHPDHYWRIVQAQYRANRRIQSASIPRNTPKLNREDIVLAFERNGYREIGLGSAIGKNISLEMAMAEALERHDSRLLEAMAVIMAKDADHKINYAILEYLADKNGQLRALSEIIAITLEASEVLKQNAKATQSLARTKKTTQMRHADGQEGAIGIGLQIGQIREKMRIYHAN